MAQFTFNILHLKNSLQKLGHLAKFPYRITSYVASSFGIWGRDEPAAYHPKPIFKVSQPLWQQSPPRKALACQQASRREFDLQTFQAVH